MWNCCIIWQFSFCEEPPCSFPCYAKSLQSFPTLCDPIDGSPSGSPVPGILQARTLEWVAISFSNAGKWKLKVKSLSHIWLLATPWTAAYQAPPSIGFSRQEYWSGVPLPSPYYLLSLIKFMICKYFLPFHRLSFHFLIISFDSQKFNFDKPNLTFLAHVFGITPKVMKVYCYVFF